MQWMQFEFKEFDKVTGEIDFYNSRNFTSNISDSFPATDKKTDPEKNMSYESVITLDQQVKKELPWWITNMKTYNAKSLLIVPQDLTIFLGVWFLRAGGFSCQAITTGG